MAPVFGASYATEEARLDAAVLRACAVLRVSSPYEFKKRFGWWDVVFAGVLQPIARGQASSFGKQRDAAIKRWCATARVGSHHG